MAHDNMMSVVQDLEIGNEHACGYTFFLTTYLLDIAHSTRLSKHPNLMRYGDPLSLKGGGEADYFGRELESRDHMEHTWREYVLSRLQSDC